MKTKLLHYGSAGLCAGLLLLGVSLSAPATAQSYPSKPVRLVVPYAAGGPADLVARILGERLAEGFQQRVVIDNKSGGNATIGTEHVARAAPDGYTLLVAAPAHTANPSLIRTIPYDAIKDFVPVSMVIQQPLFVVVHQCVPATTLRELITLVKASPGKYNYASSGAGGPQHLMGEMFKAATGTQITHIPYRGAAPAAVALLAGDTQISFGTPTNTFPHVKTGKLRALAVSTAKRSPFGPELPTLAELGFAGFDYSSWTGFLAPAGTSKEVVNRIYEGVAKALGDVETRNKLFVQGMQAVGSTPEEFADFLKLDIARSAKIIKDTGMQPE